MSTLLTLPLVAATSGTFGTVVAVIGAIKLGAAAILLKLAVARGYQNSALDAGGSYAAPEASYGAPPASGYGAPKLKRGKRDVSSGVDGTTVDGLFSLVSSMDMQQCGKALICELEAKNRDLLLEDESLILSLFGNRDIRSVNPGSAKSEYDLAAELGMVSKSQVVCRQRYSTCPYTADEMMKALRLSNI